MDQLRQEHIPGTIAVVFYDGDANWVSRKVFRKDACGGPHLPIDAELWRVVTEFCNRTGPFRDDD